MIGYTGISFPFRIGDSGGAIVTTTDIDDPTHINESIKQILGTRYLERPMVGDEVYSDLDTSLFEPNDPTTQNFIASQIVDALDRLEERISLTEGNIEFEVRTDDNGVETLYVNIYYTVNNTNQSYSTGFIEIGGSAE